jgi:thymidine phosphorylase
LIVAQGGDLSGPRNVAPAEDITAQQAGVVSAVAVAVESIGYTIIPMGGGRRNLSDTIDHSVSIEMLVNIGDTVTQGQPLIQQFTRTPDHFRKDLLGTMTLTDHAVPMPLIVKRITGEPS